MNYDFDLSIITRSKNDDYTFLGNVNSKVRYEQILLRNFVELRNGTLLQGWVNIDYGIGFIFGCDGRIDKDGRKIYTIIFIEFNSGDVNIGNSLIFLGNTLLDLCEKYFCEALDSKELNEAFINKLMNVIKLKLVNCDTKNFDENSYHQDGCLTLNMSSDKSKKIKSSFDFDKKYTNKSTSQDFEKLDIFRNFYIIGILLMVGVAFFFGRKGCDCEEIKKEFLAESIIDCKKYSNTDPVKIIEKVAEKNINESDDNKFILIKNFETVKDEDIFEVIKKDNDQLYNFLINSKNVKIFFTFIGKSKNESNMRNFFQQKLKNFAEKNKILIAINYVENKDMLGKFDSVQIPFKDKNKDVFLIAATRIQ